MLLILQPQKHSCQMADRHRLPRHSNLAYWKVVLSQILRHGSSRDLPVLTEDAFQSAAGKKDGPGAIVS